MVATGFTVAAGRVTGVIANDPWTGRQVQIDPAKKKAVVSPAGFPLTGFRVTVYRVVTLKQVRGRPDQEQ